MIWYFLFISFIIQNSFCCQDEGEEEEIQGRRASFKFPAFNKASSLSQAFNSYSPEYRFLNSFYFPVSLPLTLGWDGAPCTTTSNDSGTCVSSLQCALLGGRASGKCQLGVCCINTVNQCGAVIVQNNTYWQSPSVLNTNQVCSLVIHLDNTLLEQKKSPICQIRLDFETFSISQPNGQSVCNTDSFTVTGATNIVPVICGDNSGQHMYLSPPSPQSDIVLTFALGTSVTISQSWRIKIGLLPCGASYLAPPDCLQYYTKSSGTIQSFNYKAIQPNANSVAQLANQDYSICFRRERAMCSICYSECSLPTGIPSFALSGSSIGGLQAQSGTALCLQDYIIIPSGIDPTAPANINANDRFCGNHLNVQNLNTGSSVCSSAKPFLIEYRTDGSEGNIDMGNLGFCLNYKQNTC